MSSPRGFCVCVCVCRSSFWSACPLVLVVWPSRPLASNRDRLSPDSQANASGPLSYYLPASHFRWVWSTSAVSQDTQKAALEFCLDGVPKLSHRALAQRAALLTRDCQGSWSVRRTAGGSGAGARAWCQGPTHPKRLRRVRRARFPRREPEI